MSENEPPAKAKGKKNGRLLFLLVLASTLITLGMIELVLRWVGNDLALGNQYRFYQFDPELGWANSPGEQGTYTRAEFSYPVSNNSLGMRDAEIAERRPGEKRVAVLGDSFTWGVGAADGERYTEVVERLDPTFNLLNFGVSGYGTVQQFLQLDRVLALDPDMVIVSFCLSNDLLDNVKAFRHGYHKPVAELNADGSLAITGYPLYESRSFGGTVAGAMSRSRIVGLLRQAMRRQEEKKWMKENEQAQEFDFDDAELYVRKAPFPAEEQMVFEIASALLTQIDQKVTAAIGPGRFAVLLVPTKFELGIEEDLPENGDPDRVANELLSRLKVTSVPVIDGREVITAEDFWKRDGHWTASGHEKIGRLLADELKRRL